MADSQVVLNPGAGGAVIATDLVTGKEYQIIKIATGGSGVADEVTTASPMPVTVITSVLPTDAATAANQQTDALTDAELRAAPIVISGTVTADTGLSQPLTDAQLRALAVPVSLSSVPLATNAATESTLAAMSAKLPATLGAKTIANSMAVNIASDQTVPVIQAAPTVPINGRTTVTTAGTRVVLAGSTTVKSVTIKALGTNTGIIYVGDSAVAAANGFPLYARDTVSMDISNLNTLYIDSSVNNEGIAYIAVN